MVPKFIGNRVIVLGDERYFTFLIIIIIKSGNFLRYSQILSLTLYGRILLLHPQ